MAQIKPLKFNSNGSLVELDSNNDDLTVASLAIPSGPTLSSSGLNLSNLSLSGIANLSFSNPSTSTINKTSTSHTINQLMVSNAVNNMESDGSILFNSTSNTSTGLAKLKIPSISETPSATPTGSAAGFLIWNSSNNTMHSWNGTQWLDLTTVISAPKIVVEYIAAETINKGQPVYVSTSNTVSLANAITLSNIIGLADNDASIGQTVQVVSNGIITGLSSLTAGAQYFLSTITGTITSTIPVALNASKISLGVAKNATDLHVNINYINFLI